MPQPINYLRPSQGSGFAQSLMQGMNLGQQAKQRAMQTSIMEEKQNLAKAEVQRKALGREAIQSLIDSGETDPVKWAEIDALYPEFKDGGKRIAAALNLKNDKNTENLLLRTRNAMDVGNYDAAGKMFHNFAKAYGSKPDVAAMYQEMGDAFVDLNEDPKGLEKAIGMLDRLGVSVLGEKYFAAKKAKSDIRGVDAESGLKEAQEKEIEAKAVLEKAKAKRLEEGGVDREAIIKNKAYQTAQKRSTDTTNMFGGISSALAGLQVRDKDGKETGEIIQFGGAPDRWVRTWKQYYDGLKGDDKEQERAIMINKLNKLRLNEALQNRPPGSISQEELKILLETTPNKNASSGQIAKWLKGLAKANDTMYAEDAIRMAFIERNGDELGAKEKFTIDMGGKKIVFNKGRKADDVIRVIGKSGKLHTYAPQIGSVTIDETATVDEQTVGDQTVDDDIDNFLKDL